MQDSSALKLFWYLFCICRWGGLSQGCYHSRPLWSVWKMCRLKDESFLRSTRVCNNKAKLMNQLLLMMIPYDDVSIWKWQLSTSLLLLMMIWWIFTRAELAKLEYETCVGGIKDGNSLRSLHYTHTRVTTRLKRINKLITTAVLNQKRL